MQTRDVFAIAKFHDILGEDWLKWKQNAMQDSAKTVHGGIPTGLERRINKIPAFRDRY